MNGDRSRPILIAGAGIAGLTAALAFAERGFPVRVFERAARLDEAGAGIQLSPNATRILGRLGVLEHLGAAALKPEAVILRDGRDLRELARVRLGAFAEERWGAPYVVTHRADLQRALLDRVGKVAAIDVATDAFVEDVVFVQGGIVARVVQAGTAFAVEGVLAVAADGVRSSVRRSRFPASIDRFTGRIAWRSTMAAGEMPTTVPDLAGAVTVFLHPKVHLIAYPIRGAASVNWVAVTKGTVPEVHAGANEISRAVAFDGLAPSLRRSLDQAPWTQWPMYEVDPAGSWTDPGGMALIGDAAHAMTPYAAQGAAMAIEDADTLAGALARLPTPLALAQWERSRRPRILRVARRGRFNLLAWHAGGPIALVRNAVLRASSPERLAAAFDWLYGWRSGV